jgi:hypothetical protein
MQVRQLPSLGVNSRKSMFSGNNDLVFRIISIGDVSCDPGSVSGLSIDLSSHYPGFVQASLNNDSSKGNIAYPIATPEETSRRELGPLARSTK